MGKDVEVIWLGDNMRWSVGVKRNHLLNMASGDYVCSLDDDDWVATDYVDSILSALETNPDAVTFITSYHNNDLDETNKIYYEKRNNNVNDPDGTRHRCINHITPVKRSHALAVKGFPDATFGEDSNYALKLWNGVDGKRLLNSVVNIDKELYFYMFDPKLSRTDHLNPRHRPGVINLGYIK